MAINISIIMAVAGLLPLLIVLWKRRRVKNLLEKGDIVTGTILEVYTHRGHKGSVYYQALIQYPVYNRAPIQGSYMFGRKKTLKQYYKGRKLEICYDKNKPERFLPRDVAKNNGFLIFTIIFAVGYLILCFLLFSFMKDSNVP